jgi:hypothetical protein
MASPRALLEDCASFLASVTIQLQTHLDRELPQDYAKLTNHLVVLGELKIHFAKAQRDFNECVAALTEAEERRSRPKIDESLE